MGTRPDRSSSEVSPAALRGRRSLSERRHGARAAWPLILSLTLAVAASGCMIAPARGLRFVRVAGATEVVRVSEAELDFVARVDTGAATTSLHAFDLQIDDASEDAVANVGKGIHFQTVNTRGEVSRVDARIAAVVEVRSAQGTEYRYAVPLHLIWKRSHRRILVNLRDRSAMSYKLLVGRDWIHGNALVDVERNTLE